MSKLRNIGKLFEDHHRDREVIALYVRWYPRYKPSLHDLAEMTSDRGLLLAHTTIVRWVKRFTSEFVKRWNHLCYGSRRSWRVDGTYVKITICHTRRST
jgi:transposase-like protein